MSSADDIERALQWRRDEEKAAQQAEDRRLAELLAVAAEAARGFIELMGKHGVQPETVYGHQQVKRRKHRFAKWEIVEQYRPVAQGWVVKYSINEYDKPWLISFLQVDGQLRDCRWDTPSSSGFPNEGLLPQAPRRAIKGFGALCIQPGHEPHAPYLTVTDYSKAAQWYLG
ncbi:hypothetical protein ACFV5J_34550 [Streptomyces zaomyceticus]|uniref:hypothetical protein n=1 Tax=Streptomyces zaomyceticus TaxID=68286 RepID=UPI0036516834